METPNPPRNIDMWDWDDHDTMRSRIFDGVKHEFSRAFPMSYGGMRVDLDNIDYADPDDYSLAEQKKALLEDKFMARRLRGRLTLTDEATGDVLDSKDLTLAKVPWMTPRGTFIHGGNEYVVASQSRLLPGIYTRLRDSGEVETHFNVKRGTGNAFRLMLEPDSAQYRLRIQQANLHLYSLLHDLGVSDKDLEARWGPEILERNKSKYDGKVLDKAYERLVARRFRPEGEVPPEEKARLVREALDRMEVNARVARTNLPNWGDRTKAAAWREAHEQMEKLANEVMGTVIDRMRKAKEYSDAHSYGGKHVIMLQLMSETPEDFMVDSPTSEAGDPNFVGVTHLPSGFKMHLPKHRIPPGVAAPVVEDVLESKVAAWDPVADDPDNTDDFDPDLTPDDLQEEFSALYGRSGPRMGGMKEWPDHWFHPQGNKLGWLSWYFDYANGRRGPEDAWQIKRWKKLKARHLAQFKKKPTPRRAHMLRLWAIDPIRHLPANADKQEFQGLMDDMRSREQEKWDHVKSAFAVSDYVTLAEFLNEEHDAGIPTDGTVDEIAEAVRDWLSQLGYSGLLDVGIRPPSPPEDISEAIEPIQPQAL